MPISKLLQISGTAYTWDSVSRWNYPLRNANFHTNHKQQNIQVVQNSAYRRHSNKLKEKIYADEERRFVFWINFVFRLFNLLTAEVNLSNLINSPNGLAWWYRPTTIFWSCCVRIVSGKSGFLAEHFIVFLRLSRQFLWYCLSPLLIPSNPFQFMPHPVTRRYIIELLTGP